MPFSTGAITLTSADFSTVEDDGGYQVVLTGVFRDEVASVSLVRGPDDLPCYSGTSGQGYHPRPRNPNKLLFVTPPIPLGGGSWTIKVVQTSHTALSSGALTPFSLTAVARNWKSKTFALRRIFPPWWRMGPRKLDTVELL